MDAQQQAMEALAEDAEDLRQRYGVFDACIPYPFHLRNILIQAAVDRLVEARWTDAIHDEWIQNLRHSGRKLDTVGGRARASDDEIFREEIVSGPDWRLRPRDGDATGRTHAAEPGETAPGNPKSPAVASDPPPIPITVPSAGASV